MKITAYYLDGRVEEYNTETHYSSSTLFGSTHVGVVNYNLETDDLKDGLWIQFRYYDAGDRLSLPVTGKNGVGAQMVESAYYPILSPEELSRIAYVECDGNKILWRPDAESPLINITKFSLQSEMFCDSKNDMALSTRAVELYKIMRGIGTTAHIPRNDGETDDQWNKRIADHIGWNVEELMKYVSPALEELEKTKVRFAGEADDNTQVVDPGVLDAATSPDEDGLAEFIEPNAGGSDYFEEPYQG